MLAHHIRGVFAMPVVVAGEYVGALDLFRAEPGLLEGRALRRRYRRRRTRRRPAAGPPRTTISRPPSPTPSSDAWAELNTLSRAEVSQATGMLVAQLGVEPAEALVRLRAHAYATGRSATDVARDILDRRLSWRPTDARPTQPRTECDDDRNSS